MVKHRPDISKVVKKALKREAGDKCANPGCPNGRTQIHHIREWAVYQTHDAAHMIAVCPACHDLIHHGKLEISDEKLYRWKGLRDPTSALSEFRRGAFWVEPARHRRIHLGTLWVTAGIGEHSMFDLGAGGHVKFLIGDDDIAAVELSVVSLDGRELASIRHTSHTKVVRNEPGVTVVDQPGRLSVTVPCEPSFLPAKVIETESADDPEFANAPVTVLDVEVIAPGEVRVRGMWFSEDAAVRITDAAIKLISLNSGQGPLSIIGDPVSGTGFVISGEFGAKSLFNFFLK